MNDQNCPCGLVGKSKILITDYSSKVWKNFIINIIGHEHSWHSGRMLDWHSIGVSSILLCGNFYFSRKRLTQTSLNTASKVFSFLIFIFRPFKCWYMPKMSDSSRSGSFNAVAKKCIRRIYWRWPTVWANTCKSVSDKTNYENKWPKQQTIIRISVINCKKKLRFLSGIIYKQWTYRRCM